MVLQHKGRVAPVRKQLGRWIRQHIGDHVGSARVEHLLALCLVVLKEHRPRRVADLADGHQRYLLPVVGQGRIDLGHVDRPDLGATERQRQTRRLA